MIEMTTDEIYDRLSKIQPPTLTRKRFAKLVDAEALATPPSPPPPTQEAPRAKPAPPAKPKSRRRRSAFDEYFGTESI